ncbi:MAG TPA: ATPase, T2SS/T4P/T4SS family [Ktedonobacteraceae bacterium]|nr:ATPase, T2SS/T4P/T4SS family [Ktedonobacteraceae bacterium]
MQPDQPGDASLAAAQTQTERSPRARVGTGARGSMRVTNRYTMPPLTPRTRQQRSTNLWDAQGSVPFDEDAWLNDALPTAPARIESRESALPAGDGHIIPGHRLWPVVYRLNERVCQELAHRRSIVEGADAELEELARRYAVDMLRAEPALADQIYNLTQAEQVVQGVIDEALGSGPLAALLRDASVTEVLAVGPRLTMIERNGDMLEVPCHFENEQHMNRIVENIMRSAGRVFDPSIAITNARLPDGTFVNVIMPPSAVKGPTITMRKRRKSVPTLAELVVQGTMSQPMADFLRTCVQARLNIVICGGLRSGRTTLLNALAACISDTERIVTLEDVAELKLNQKQVVSFEARLTGSDSSVRELLLCALHMRPERVILGDCWNDEAGVLLSALYAGCDGSLFNAYANGLQDCLSRLEMLWLASRPGASISTVREQVARAVHLVIYLARLSAGPRKVMNIAQVLGVERGRVKARSIFHYQENADGQGRFEPEGLAQNGLAQMSHTHAAR